MSGPTYTVYRAIQGLENELRAELLALELPVSKEVGPLFLVERPYKQVLWAQNTWIEARVAEVTSISQTAKLLKDLQRNWGLTPTSLHRRCQLIQDQLPKISIKPLPFLAEIPSSPMGGWTLLDEKTLLYSPKTTSPFADGAFSMLEDHENPPSRAYLKLWEFFTLTGLRPGPGETCIDMGSCPGGWTWVLQGLGAEVISVDKAPIEPRIASLPGVSTRQESAFGLDPLSVPNQDWFFSDIICYPERLYTLVQKWMAADRARNFVCTIKFQGETDFVSLERFKAIPGSKVVHLHHNKHEVTWYLIR